MAATSAPQETNQERDIRVRARAVEAAVTALAELRGIPSDAIRDQLSNGHLPVTGIEGLYLLSVIEDECSLGVTIDARDLSSRGGSKGRPSVGACLNPADDTTVGRVIDLAIAHSRRSN